MPTHSFAYLPRDLAVTDYLLTLFAVRLIRTPESLHKSNTATRVALLLLLQTTYANIYAVQYLRQSRDQFFQSCTAENYLLFCRRDLTALSTKTLTDC